MPYPKLQYDTFHNEHISRWGTILQPPVKPRKEELDKFLESLLYVRHHDEYYSILENKTLKLTQYGIKRCLRYDVEDGDEGQWGYYNMLDMIHDKYRDMYLKWMKLAYALSYEKRLSVRSLQHRLIINYPVQKANGKHVWVKEMTMPWQLDANNVMVTQISSYTIVCKYLGFNLPVAPRFYNDKNERAVAFERQFFKQFWEETRFELPERLKRIVQAIVDLDAEKKPEEKEMCFKKHKMPLTTQEISKRTFLGKRTLGTYFYEIHREVENTFGWDFKDHYDAAMFLKGLRYVRPLKQAT